MRSNFFAAQQDYAVAVHAVENGDSNSYGNGNGNGNGNGFHHDAELSAKPPCRPGPIRMRGILYIPRIDWLTAGLQEEPSQYEITVKLFFLPTAPVASRAQFVREALGLVLKELRVPCIDLPHCLLPGMSFEGDCEWEADKVNATQGNDEEEMASWRAVEELHREGLVKSLGIAEFGSEKLSRFLKKPRFDPPSTRSTSKTAATYPSPYNARERAEHRAARSWRLH